VRATLITANRDRARISFSTAAAGFFLGDPNQAVDKEIVDYYFLHLFYTEIYTSGN